jgi:hypothetical protein
METKNPLGDRMEWPYPVLLERKNRGTGRQLAECAIDTAGKIRYAYLRYDGKEVKERVPLFFWKMSEEGQEAYMDKLAIRLRGEFWIKHGVRV